MGLICIVTSKVSKKQVTVSKYKHISNSKLLRLLLNHICVCTCKY